MSGWRSLAVGSSAGWVSIMVANVVAGTANLGTFGCIVVPSTFWATALLVEARREKRRQKTVTSG